MKIILWIPLVCLAGFMIGSCGAKEELRAIKESVKVGQRESARKAGGFDTFANIVKIPEMARRPRRDRRSAKKGAKVVPAKSVAMADASRDAVRDTQPTNAVAGKSQERNAPQSLSREDLSARIAEAQDLWRTRVDVSRAQWKDKLKLSGESEKAFDAALQEMNERLYDSVAAVADLVADMETMTPELGLRLVGETTAIMAETYDRIGACVPQSMRSDVSSMQMVDFVDPGVAEPLIGVQGKLDGFARPGGRQR
jgi:hypothetical protein